MVQAGYKAKCLLPVREAETNETYLYYMLAKMFN